jgi:hypothetical protein
MMKTKGTFHAPRLAEETSLAALTLMSAVSGQSNNNNNNNNDQGK